MKKIFFCLLVGFTLVGCSGPQAIKKANKAVDTLEDKQTVVILNRKLASKISIVNQKADWTEDGRLKVNATLFNKQNKDLRVQLQTVFKDNDGFSTNDETNFEPVIIPANAYFYYEAESMNNLAETYVIRVQ